MKLLAILLVTTAGLWAQTTVTLTGPATARPGAILTLALSAAGATGTGSAAFQWTLGLPAGYTATEAVGAAGTAAGKATTCTTDNSMCLLYGMNATVIGNGVLAAYAITVPASAAAGPVTIPLSGVIAASPAGTVVSTTMGAPYSFAVLAKQDINGDGKVDATDLQLMVAEVIASQANPAACVNDMNGDGKCDLLDVISVLLKVLGQ